MPEPLLLLTQGGVEHFGIMHIGHVRHEGGRKAGPLTPLKINWGSVEGKEKIHREGLMLRGKGKRAPRLSAPTSNLH